MNTLNLNSLPHLNKLPDNKKINFRNTKMNKIDIKTGTDNLKNSISHMLNPMKLHSWKTNKK